MPIAWACSFHAAVSSWLLLAPVSAQGGAVVGLCDAHDCPERACRARVHRALCGAVRPRGRWRERAGNKQTNKRNRSANEQTPTRQTATHTHTHTRARRQAGRACTVPQLARIGNCAMACNMKRCALGTAHSPCNACSAQHGPVRFLPSGPKRAAPACRLHAPLRATGARSAP